MGNLTSAYWIKIGWTALVIALIYILKYILLNHLHKKIPDTVKFYKVKRSINLVVLLVAVLVLGAYWLSGGANIVTYLGLLSAGLALALREIILNIAAWIYIIVRQPFAVGDRIEIDHIKGDVIDQNILKFNVMEVGNWVDAEQSTGRLMHIPNYKIFTDSIANYSLGFEYIWEEIKVVITFESDWQKAKKILEQIVEDSAEDVSEIVQEKIKEMSRKYMIFYNNLTPIVYTDVREHGVRLTMRFVCMPRKRRNMNQKIWEAILQAFNQEPDIEFAYPTYRRVD